MGRLSAILLASVGALVAARVAALVGPVPEVPPRLAIVARRALALLAWVAWVGFCLRCGWALCVFSKMFVFV